MNHKPHKGAERIAEFILALSTSVYILWIEALHWIFSKLGLDKGEK